MKAGQRRRGSARGSFCRSCVSGRQKILLQIQHLEEIGNVLIIVVDRA